MSAEKRALLEVKVRLRHYTLQDKFVLGQSFFVTLKGRERLFERFLLVNQYKPSTLVGTWLITKGPSSAWD